MELDIYFKCGAIKTRAVTPFFYSKRFCALTTLREFCATVSLQFHHNYI